MMNIISQFLTQEQAKAIVERAALVLVTWLVTNGYITASDAANWVALIVGIAGALYAWWVNRDKALVRAASTVPNTVVVTDNALAASTPEPNIVSSDIKEVVSKAAS